MSRAHDLRELATRVRRLTPDGRDPERYHVEKDAIASEIADIAEEVDQSQHDGRQPGGRRRRA